MEAQEEVVVPTAEEAPDVLDTAAGTEAPESGENKEQEAPPKTFTQEELNAIVAKERAREARKAAREAQRQLTETLKTIQQPKQEDRPGKPSPEQFQTTEDYVEAVAAWKADEIIQQTFAKREKETAEAKARDEQEKVVATYQEREDSAREKYDDFDQVAYQTPYACTPAMAQTIQFSENGPDLAYFLGKNPTEAARIAALPPILAIKELGMIEAKITSAATPETRVSKAPEPIKPVGGTRGTVTSTMPQDSDPIDVWMKKERARQNRR